MDFGVDISIFYPYYSVEEALNAVEKAGFRYIEYPYEYFRNYEEHSLENRVKEIADIAGSFNVKPYQLHAAYGEINFRLGSLDEKSRESAIRETEKWIRYANILDTPVLVVHLAFTRPIQTISYIDAVKRIAKLNLELARRLAKVGEEYNIKIAFENCLEPWFGASPTDLIWLLSEANSEYLGACLDTGHANVNRLNVAEAVRQLRQFLIATHIHDNNARHDQHYPPFIGTIDWREVVAAFKEIRYKYPLIYEVFGNGRRKEGSSQLTLLKIITKFFNNLV